MKGKNLYILLAVVILVLILGIFFIFSNKDSKQNIIKENTGSKNVYNPQQEKQENQQISLPDELETCKNQADLVDCVLHYDSSEGKKKDIYTLNKKNLSNRLDDISSHIDSINQQKENFEEKLVSDLQEQQINYNPEFVIREVNCKTSFCEKIVKSVKKKVIKEMKSLGRLSGPSACGRISSEDLRQYCKDLF